jgi:hypothetical protein
MNELPEDLGQHLPYLSDRQLLSIATADRGQYQPAAMTLVHEELRRRGLHGVTLDTYHESTTHGPRLDVSPSQQRTRWLGWVHFSVQDRISARIASNQGIAASLIVATTATLAAVVGGLRPQSTGIRISPQALVLAGIYLVIAFGIWRRSRLAAASALVLWGAKLLTSPPEQPLVHALAIILFLAFINGFRGTWALHSFTTQPKPSSVQTLDSK